MKLVRNAGVMGIAVLLSRLLGLIREQVFAYLFGAGMYSDASLVAYRIPNLLRDLLAEGALSSSFVSVFSKETEAKARQDLYSEVSRLLLWVLLLLTLLIFFASPWLVELMAGAFREIPGKFELTIYLTKILAPFLLFTSLGALSMGLLNSLGVYFLPALGAAAFNLSSIIVGGFGGLYLLSQGRSLYEATVVFALGTLFGGFLSWAIQWPEQQRRGFSVGRAMKNFWNLRDVIASLRDPRIQRMLTMIAPAAVSVGALQINIFVNTGIASELAEGSVTWLNYAYRLLHFPMGIFGVSLFMAALPKLSSLTSDRPKFEETLQEGMGLSLFVSVGAAVGLATFAEPIMALLFEHGRFGAEDVIQSSRALQAYSLGLIAFNLNKIYSSAFFALESMWTPAFLSLVSVIANYIFATNLSPLLGHVGIALSVSLTSFLNTVLLIVFLRRMGVQVSVTFLLRVLLGSALALAPMIIFYFFRGSGILWSLKGQSLLVGMTAILFSIAIVSTLYFLISIYTLKEGRAFFEKVMKPKMSRFLRMS